MKSVYCAVGTNWVFKESSLRFVFKRLNNQLNNVRAGFFDFMEQPCSLYVESSSDNINKCELRSMSVDGKHQFHLRVLLSSVCQYKGLPPYRVVSWIAYGFILVRIVPRKLSYKTTETS